ncbi:MAG TPA: TetR/AcrR family transcriptional regulator [Candidatus Dormibacteraeota bacterium]|nr:TetR/AcrR family transcriptional regulator [Candidatus Dormibacteraeota bacterium]
MQAAWEVAREKGLAGLSLGDVAAKVGMRVPSLYSYFASKNEIYDTMFAQGNEQFLDFIRSRREGLPRSARQRLRAGFWITFDFCTADPVRYQLLFQRTVPGFTPSESSYARALEVLDLYREELREMGLLGDQSDEDLLTALSIGLVDQQISNEPGGQRWARLVDDVADMAYEHLSKKRRRRRAARQPEVESRTSREGR